jgi:hypothetical protein
LDAQPGTTFRPGFVLIFRASGHVVVPFHGKKIREMKKSPRSKPTVQRDIQVITSNVVGFEISRENNNNNKK